MYATNMDTFLFHPFCAMDSSKLILLSHLHEINGVIYVGVVINKMLDGIAIGFRKWFIMLCVRSLLIDLHCLIDEADTVDNELRVCSYKIEFPF